MKFIKSFWIATLVTLILTTVTAFSFFDVGEFYKNATAINFLESEGIVSGYPDGSFKPEQPISRAEITKILVGATGANPLVSDYNNCFVDVKTDWYAPFVCYAKSEGWLNGYPDGTFKPAQLVNKVEALKILVESQKLKIESNVDLPFSDVKSTAWYVPYLITAVSNNLLEQSTGIYGVADYITRGEVSENIYRSIKLNEKLANSGTNSFVEDRKHDTSNVKPNSTKTPATPDILEGPYTVTKVVDGDTMDIQIANKTVRLRLIGMDTPETVHPSKPVQCFGREASARAKDLLLGKSVYLEADMTQGDKDIYGRSLRYILLADNGTNFNLKMIADGYAFEYTYNKPYKYQDEFKQAQKEARKQGKGLWSVDTCNGQVDGNVKTNTSSKNIKTTNYTYKVSTAAKKYYYCETDSAWEGLKPSNVRTYYSEAELLADFPNLVLKREC